MEKYDFEAQGGSEVLQKQVQAGPELSALKQARANMKKNITNLKKKVEKDGKQIYATILECRLEILESYFKQLNHIKGKIEQLYPADNVRSDNEDLFTFVEPKQKY